MAQPIKKVEGKVIPKTKKAPRKRKHKEYGTSKLEIKFAENFLDKLGVKYIYQFKAPTQRVYDFYCPDENVIIEVDGDYWHAKDLVYEEMNPTQKKNKRVDKQKDHWALINGIPIIRIWETDINKNPSKVMKLLKDKLSKAKEVKIKEDSKKTRDFYRHQNKF